MTVTYVSIWETKILDTIKGFLDDEFKGILDIYIGDRQDSPNAIRIVPLASNLISADAIQETRLYSLEIWFYFSNKSAKLDILNHVLKYINRIEALFHDNMNNTYFDGMIQRTEIGKEDNGYAIRFDYTCKYAGNMA